MPIPAVLRSVLVEHLGSLGHSTGLAFGESADVASQPKAQRAPAAARPAEWLQHAALAALVVAPSDRRDPAGRTHSLLTAAGVGCVA